MQIDIPEVLARNVAQIWAGNGRRWLDELPTLLTEIASSWNLRLGAPYPLSYHWVSPATRPDGTIVVLKVGVPSQDLADQAEALQIYDGRGSARLLADDLPKGALLLERVAPGTSAAVLVPTRDAEATAALIQAGRQLHRTPPAGCTLPHLSRERRTFQSYLARYPGDHPLPRRIVLRASAVFHELLSGGIQPVILHGDLHHDNVLRAEREPWLAIDPKGLIGDPGYDCTVMLYNPAPWQREDHTVALVPARIDQLSDGFGVPRERIVAWGFVRAVLSEVWTALDGGQPGGRALDVAILLEPELH
jgi:streptomycin 6-kinase